MANEMNLTQDQLVQAFLGLLVKGAAQGNADVLADAVREEGKVEMFAQRDKDNARRVMIPRIVNGEPDFFVGHEIPHNQVRRVTKGDKVSEKLMGPADKVVMSVDIAGTELAKLVRIGKPGRFSKETLLDLTIMDDDGADRSADLIKAFEMAIDTIKGCVAVRAKRAMDRQMKDATVKAAEEVRQRAVEVE